VALGSHVFDLRIDHDVVLLEYCLQRDAATRWCNLRKTT
jgi:hypothetical protein